MLRSYNFWQFGPNDKQSNPLFVTWKAMIRRCEKVCDPAYYKYGGRGITVCKRWHDLKCFAEDMGPKPSSQHTLDRIDNDGNYEPSNCQWSDGITQSNNKRNNLILEHCGETMTLAQWSRKTGVAYQTIVWRYKQRMDSSRILQKVAI